MACDPQLNVLINNAWFAAPGEPPGPRLVAAAEDTIATTLLGTIRMVYAFLPLLVGRSDAVVMDVSSALAFVPFPVTPTYTRPRPRCTPSATAFACRPPALASR